MKTLLLGATGFLGQEILSFLPKRNLSVLVSRDVAINAPQLQIVRGQLLTSPILEMISHGSYDRIIDCSWSGLPDRSPTNNETNLQEKHLLIEAAKRGKVTEFISMGTCLEYGGIIGKVSEIQIGRGIDSFGNTKLQILNLIRDSGIQFKWFRLFYLLGRNQHKESLVHSAIRAYSKGEEFFARNPSASFDYIGVNDAAKAVATAIQTDGSHGIFNIGSGKPCSVNEILNVLREHFNMKALVIPKEPALYADISKIKKVTNWSPNFSTRETLLDIVNYLIGDR